MLKNIVAAAQMTSGADVHENLQQAERLIKQAAAQGAKLIVLPEMFPIMGKVDTDKLKVQEKLGSGLIQAFLSTQAAAHKIWIVGGTIPISTDNPQKVNAACLVYNAEGKQIARYDKIHMFDVLVSAQTYQESATMHAGDQAVVLDSPFGKIGLMVCYDLRFPELARSLVDNGAEIIAIPTAFTKITGAAHWEVLTRSLAILNQCYVIAACEVGTHPNGRETFGHSTIIDPWGIVLNCLPDGIGLVSAEIDLARVAEVRKNMPLQKQRRLG